MIATTKVYDVRVIAIAFGLLTIFSLLGIQASALQNNSTTTQIVVTSLDDSIDVNGNADGTCPDPMRCTLRAAIDQAERTNGAVTIIFGLSGTITLADYPLVIGGSGLLMALTIDGHGQSIVIDGNQKPGIIALNGNAPKTTLDTLVLQNSVGKPAIDNQSGTLTIDNCSLINNNVAAGDDDNGGAIFNLYGRVSINNNTFSGNKAYYGGAIYNEYIMTISDSTISGNNAFWGGGINSNFGDVTLVNTIVAKNTASRGPDIFGKVVSLGHNLIGDGSDSSFLVNYDATEVYNAANPQSVQNLNKGTLTAVALYADRLTPSAYASPTWTPTPVGFAPTATPPDMQNYSTDQVGTAASPIDPMLGGLTSGGGSMWILAPLPGSPVIGHGDCIGNTSVNPPIPAVTTDQRGVQRQNPCSIGAIEGQTAALPATSSPSP